MQARQNLRIILLCILLTGGMLLHFTGCSAEIKAADLMEGIKTGPVAEKAADEAFLLASADFAAALFRNISASGQQENSLVSPAVCHAGASDDGKRRGYADESGNGKSAGRIATD